MYLANIVHYSDSIDSRIQLTFIMSRPCFSYAVVQLVESLLYKPEGRGFNYRFVTGTIHLHYPSVRTMALRSTQPLTEMSTRSVY